jgi:hypothetical protein
LMHPLACTGEANAIASRQAVAKMVFMIVLLRNVALIIKSARASPFREKFGPSDFGPAAYATGEARPLSVSSLVGNAPTRGESSGSI